MRIIICGHIDKNEVPAYYKYNRQALVIKWSFVFVCSALEQYRKSEAIVWPPVVANTVDELEFMMGFDFFNPHTSTTDED